MEATSERAVQPEFISRATNGLSFPPSSSALFPLIALPLSALLLRLLIRLCNTVLWALTDVSLGLCSSAQPKPNPAGQPRPVPASLRYSARHFVCVFIKSLSICDQEHVFQATLRRSRVITRGGRTNFTVSFQLWKCSWSHGTLTQRKTMNFLCVLRLGLAAGIFSIGKQKKMTALWLHASVQQSYT